MSAAGGPGEARARFEAVLRPLLPALHGLAVKLIRRPEDASDLVQEACLRAYRTFGNFRPGTNAKAWLFQILYSVFVNDYRARKRAPSLESIDELEGRYDRVREIADERALDAILRNPELEWKGSRVEQALSALQEDHRHVLLLVDVMELTYEEAATTIDCPPGTLRSRLFRARRALAARLLEEAGLLQRLGEGEAKP